MSAGSMSGIGPVSVRYAAQIRELLQAQAMHRMAADEEAARASHAAEKAARLEAPSKPKDAPKPAGTNEPVQAKASADASKPDTPAAAADKPATATPAQLVDVRA